MPLALWQADPYGQQLDTEVLACEPTEGGWVVRLAATILYPEGGGQPSDRGRIGAAAVIDVQDSASGVLHTVSAPLPVGPVRVVLDWDRRFDHMQQHTGQHLITAVLQDRFGAATTSFHLGRELCAIELDVPPLSASVMKRAEAEVQTAIREARPVTQQVVEPGALEGLGVRSRGLPDGHVGDVRVVDIEGLDRNTCGGTHLRSTAELQTVAFLDCERARGGCRLTFLAGDRVGRAFAAARARERAMSGLLSRPPEEHAGAIRTMLASRKDAAREQRALMADLADGLGSGLGADAGRAAGLHRDGVDLKFLNAVAGAALRRTPETLLLLTTGEPEGMFLLAGPADRVADLGPEVAARLGGRGGGAKGRFQGRATDTTERHAVIAWLGEAP